MIMYPNKHFSINEVINQDLSFLECKRNFNRKQFPKNSLDLLAVLNIVARIVYNWSSSLSSSKETEKKDKLGQNPFDINIRTIIAFHHIKLENGIVG